MHAVRSEEAVVDALGERVLEDRVAEISIRVGVLSTQRGCRHAKLGGGLEVFEDGPPRRIVASAASMALVHDHQVEEVPRIVAEDPEGIAHVGH